MAAEKCCSTFERLMFGSRCEAGADHRHRGILLLELSEETIGGIRQLQGSGGDAASPLTGLGEEAALLPSKEAAMAESLNHTIPRAVMTTDFMADLLPLLGTAGEMDQDPTKTSAGLCQMMSPQRRLRGSISSTLQNTGAQKFVLSLSLSETRTG